MRPLLPTLLALLPLAAACGGSDPVQLTDEGVQALNAGDASGALAKLDQALAKLPEGDPDWQRAAIERLRALARVDPARASSETATLGRVHPQALEAADYETVAGELRARRAYLEATEVLELGIAQHPESPKLQALVKQIGDEAQSAGDTSGALDKLKGLGYAGDQ
jgi:hypothetical protein